MKLSSYSQGRDNNFNLIRIAAALAVLVEHSFVLATGTIDAEPLKTSLGISIGSIAVDVFFITSGFLVTASLMTRQSTIEFFWARVLRIFPALWVMLLLTVFVLGLFFTSLPLSLYLSDSRTHSYLVKCSTLFAGAADNLPGVFDINPFKGVVNGSLWSLPYEVRLYTILAVVWLTLQITRKYRLDAFKIAIVTYAVLSGIYILANEDISHFYFATAVRSPELSFMFFTGAAFYVLKEHIFLSRSFFWFIVIALSLAIGHKHMFLVIYLFSIAYLLFFLAYIPSGHIRKYNSVGDYSYGIYIYAFPIQQSIVALIPGVSVFNLLLISVIATILVSVISWHLLEQRALSLKGRYLGYARRLLNFTNKCIKSSLKVRVCGSFWETPYGKTDEVIVED